MKSIRVAVTRLDMFGWVLILLMGDKKTNYNITSTSCAFSTSPTYSTDKLIVS